MKSVAAFRPTLLAAAWLALHAAPSVAKPGDLTLLPEPVGIAQLYAAEAYSGLALGGRDPVSYQVRGNPAAGGAESQVLWSGLAWRFASEANRAAFLRSPEAFAPRIGGYDAESASEGRLVEADPDIFLVLTGRLYLFRTEAARTRFMADPGAAARAEALWPKLGGSLVRG